MSESVNVSACVSALKKCSRRFAKMKHHNALLKIKIKSIIKTEKEAESR